MDPKFEKSNEIYFRLGIIYKQQQKYDTSLEVTGFSSSSPSSSSSSSSSVFLSLPPLCRGSDSTFFLLLFFQCFRYIRNNPPVPLAEADIYFQIGHVYEQKKEVQTITFLYELIILIPDHLLLLLFHSTCNQRRLTKRCSPRARSTPRFFSSWDGSTTRLTPPSPTKTPPSSFSPAPSKQVRFFVCLLFLDTFT